MGFFKRLFKKLNLKSKIILGALLISVLPLLVVFYYSVNRFQNTLTNSSSLELKEKSYLAGQVINHYLEDRVGDTRLLSNIQDFKSPSTPAMNAYLKHLTDYDN